MWIKSGNKILAPVKISKELDRFLEKEIKKWRINYGNLYIKFKILLNILIVTNKYLNSSQFQAVFIDIMENLAKSWQESPFKS
jgi:predicted nucleic acid-binding protein